MSRIVTSALVIVLSLAMLALAGTTGKIAGLVTDAESGSPIPGVNILLEGTPYGAVSTIDGRYTILNVPPGVYDMKFSILGYKEFKVRQVRVTIDITTEMNARMVSQTLEGENVVVVAQRPVVTRDISSSQMNIEVKTMESMPVQSVKEVLSLQAGIQASSAGILVRGGGANQTVMMLDGLSLNDERSNIPYAAISMSSVQEVKVQTGGFNAEYGNVRSGLVNVVTKEGDASRYHFTTTLRYSPPASKHFGTSLYDPMSYFNRPFMDPAVCYVGTKNGSWDEYTQTQYLAFEGWQVIADKTLQDDNPANDLTAEGAKKLFEWQHRRQGDIKKPDYVVDAGFGGPVPFLSKYGSTRFFISHFREQDMFIYPLSTDAYRENYTQLKVTTDIKKNMKLIVTGLYGDLSSAVNIGYDIPDGSVVRSQSTIADYLGAGDSRTMLYTPAWSSPSDIYRQLYGIQFTHMLNTHTFYEVALQYNYNRYNTYQMTKRDTSRIYQPVPGYFVDELPYGYSGMGGGGITGERMSDWQNFSRDKSVNTTTNFRFDLTSQVNFRHQIKTGVQVVYNDYDIKASSEHPTMGTWRRSMYYNVFPYRIGAYLQDKIEFEGFIANVGLRMDYSDPNSDVYQLKTFDKQLGPVYGSSIEQSAEKVQSEAKIYWSPRLGVSHPITANSKLYFNYGHFRSEASSSTRFRLSREANGQIKYIGNPDLELEKTVAYELGYSQNLFNMLLLNVAAYYKDVTNQPGSVQYRSLDGMVDYSVAENNFYADIRGFEVTLNKQMGEWLTGFINYTYDVRTSGYFGLLMYYENSNKQREYLRNNLYQEKPHPLPYARANVDFHTPNTFGPAVAGFKPLAGLNFNILADWQEGGFYTYNPNNIPGVVDNCRYKDWYNIDLRITKSLNVDRMQFQFYVDWSNVLNTKYFSVTSYADTYDRLDYLASLNFDWETGDEKGDDKIGELRPQGVKYDPLELNPNNDPEISKRNQARKDKKSYIDNPNIDSLFYLNPRDITFGLKINF